MEDAYGISLAHMLEHQQPEASTKVTWFLRVLQVSDFLSDDITVSAARSEFAKQVFETPAPNGTLIVPPEDCEITSMLTSSAVHTEGFQVQKRGRFTTTAEASFWRVS